MSEPHELEKLREALRPFALNVDDLIWDIQETVIGHIDTMYPAMWKDVPKSARLSIRNTIGNKLRAALSHTAKETSNG